MKLLALVCLALGASAGGGDSDEQCCGWAIMDECETNPFWMKVNCQKSCGTIGCTVAEAKADSAGASGACKSNIDQGFLASCKWNRAFLEANWNRGGHGGHHEHGAGESSFIVPDAGAAGASAGGYGGEEKVEPAPAMDAPAPEPVVEEPIVVDIVEEVPEEPAPAVVVEEPAPAPVEIVEPAPAPVEIEEPAPAPVEVEEPAPAPIPVYEEEEEEVEEEVPEPIIEPMPIEVEEIAPVEEEPEPVLEVPVVEAAEEPLPQMDVVEEAPVEEEAAPAAEDSNESCCGWAAYEECGKNPTWMAKNCAASCHVKDGKVDDAAAIAAAEAACPEYRELFLAGVPLGQAKKEEKVEEEAAPVEEEAAPVEEEAAPVEEEAAPVEEEAPVEEAPVEEEPIVEEPVVEEPVEEEAPVEEAPVEEAPVEEVAEATEAPAEPVVEEEAPEEPAMDFHSGGGYRRLRASRH